VNMQRLKDDVFLKLLHGFTETQLAIDALLPKFSKGERLAEVELLTPP
jgi:hypothetical protein